MDPDKWEFAHEGFLRGQKHLLKLIRRRKTAQPNASQQPLDPCVEVGRFGLDGEVDRLQRDKQVCQITTKLNESLHMSIFIYVLCLEIC